MSFAKQMRQSKNESDTRAVLQAIQENGPCETSYLRLLCHMSESSVLRSLRKLEEAGHIERDKHPEDARKTTYMVPKSAN